jgi:hypothetical protein
MTRQEEDHIKKLIGEGMPPEKTVRRIFEDMPHLQTEQGRKEIGRVASVMAEMAKEDGAELEAGMAASQTMIDILAELGAPDLATALPILAERAERGDRRAIELIARFNEAAANVGMGDGV